MIDNQDLFQQDFKNKNYKSAYENFIKWNKLQADKIENFEKYLKISNDIYQNLEQYTEDELLKKASVAANMMQYFFVQNLCLLILIKNPECLESLYIWAKYALEDEYYWEAYNTIEQVFEYDKPDKDAGKYLRLAAEIYSKIYLYEQLNENDKILCKERILKYLTNASELEPDNIENYIALTRFYSLDFQNADNATIIKLWNKIIKMEPENSWFYSSRASVKSLVKDYKGAISDYKKAIKHGDIDYMTYRELANNYHWNKQTEKAKKLYQIAIKEYENNPEMQTEMIIGLAAVNEWQRNYIEAEKIYLELLNKYPNNLRIRALLADVQYWTQNYEQGVKNVDIILAENNPDYTTMYLTKAICLDKLKRFNEAIECCDKVIEEYPDYFASYVDKCLALCSLEKYEEALIYIQKAIELNPDYSDSWVQLGYVQFYLKDYENAFKNIDKGLDINSDNLYANRIKAFFYYLLDDMKNALSNINSALGINKGISYEAEELYLRHLIYKKLGKEKMSKSDYNKTFEINPNFDIKDFESKLKL